MSLQLISHWRITCDAPDCNISRDVNEAWDEYQAVRFWEIFGGTSGTWEWAKAYCENHADLAEDEFS